MRKADDVNYRPDWNVWFKNYGEEHTKFRGSTHKDKFDSTVDGTWLERWDTDKKS